ncbi:retrovirus-related pol polyprotein from transposon TNT 1-94 [Tanacetum coccineum]
MASQIPLTPSKTQGEDVTIFEKGEECGFDSKEDDVVARVEVLSLVDGVLEGAFCGEGDDDFTIGDGVTRTKEHSSEVLGVSGEENDENAKDETCPVAQASNEICLGVDFEPDEWIKDGGCSKHMTGNQKLFSTYKAYNGGNVIFGSNLRGNIIGKGTISNDSFSVDNSYEGNLYTLVIVDDYSRTDHGREFDNEVQFGEFCKANGITHNLSAPRTPQSNGVVERKNRTLQEMNRTMLNEQSLPQKFWCNAVDTSTYILNRILIGVIFEKIPYELLRGRKPTLDYFRVFGSKCFILNTKDYLTKFDQKSYECVFLGYSQNSKAYIILNKHTMKIEESLNVTFDKTPPPSKTSPLVDDDLDEEEAIKLNDHYARRIKSVRSNDVLELVPQPKNMTIIGTKWVFRNKLDENGVVSRNKARLVAQDYNQQEGIDYDETYTSIARLESIRILLAYACASDFKLFQMDVKSAFLNGFINEEFEMSMIGELNFFLGLQIKKMEDSIFFNQSKYIKEMLKKFGLEDSKPMKTPMSSDTKIIKDEECESVDSTKYQSVVGSLLYLTTSRPDIMFSICLCARFQEAPKTSHLEAVKRILRYIKGTTYLGLWYPKGTDIETIVYADSDHAGDYVDKKSTSGICTFVGCCLTSWFSKKQTALAISTTESKYVSAEKECQQAQWMKQALIDYNIRLDDVPIMCDNKGVIDLSKNPVQHSRTKHIEIRHHFLRDNVQKGYISIEKVSSVDNITDILTKLLKRESFKYLRLGLGMM